MARPGFALGIGAGRVKTLGPMVLASLGALTAFSAMTLKVRAPEAGTIVGLSMNIAAKGGTHVTSALAVQNAGAVVGTFDVDAAVAGTPLDIEGSSLANVAMLKDAVISLVATEAGGTSPTWQGVTLQIDYVPTGD